MPSSADVYLEKLAAVRAAAEAAVRVIGRLTQAAEAFGDPSSEGWRTMIIPDGPAPISRAARLDRQRLPDWPTQEEVKECVAAYQEAFREVHGAYKALTPTERAGVQGPPPYPE